MTQAKPHSKKIQGKLDMFLAFLERSQKLDEINFSYWLEDKPDTLVEQWGREKVHPTSEMIQENEIQRASIDAKIKTVADELCELFTLQEQEISTHQ